MHELVKDGGAGLLFNPGDENNLQDKICALWDEGLIRKLSANAVEYVKKQHDPCSYADKIIEVYSSLVLGGS